MKDRKHRFILVFNVFAANTFDLDYESSQSGHMNVTLISTPPSEEQI